MSRASALAALVSTIALVALPALAQVDRPADVRMLPRGHGWYCYPEPMATGQAAYRCERHREGCARSGTAAAAACMRERSAQCITFTGRDVSTRSQTHGFVCMRSRNDCEDARRRVFSEANSVVVSACTEIR
jgi:hypothetical protein